MPPICTGDTFETVPGVGGSGKILPNVFNVKGYNPGGHLKKCRSPGQEKCRESASESAGPKRGAEEGAEKSAPGSAPM